MSNFHLQNDKDSDNYEDDLDFLFEKPYFIIGSKQLPFIISFQYQKTLFSVQLLLHLIKKHIKVK